MTKRNTTLLVWLALLFLLLTIIATRGESEGRRILGWLIVLLAVVAALAYFLKRLQGSSGTIFELRKSRARPVEDESKAKFSEIGGNRQAVEMLADLVEFLRDPERWNTIGIRIPRGVLMVGPPGAGKTLLARAVAGESDAAFLYTSAAEFVEMFVGVGAARVRDTFERAAAQQPAIIFIDELDAIGRRRGSGMGAIHEEREQTLNQLLVCMDGLERHSQLVVIAATNRPDVIDSALLRSGRFDRVLRLELPTLEERVDILKIHTRNKPLAPDVSLEAIARKTNGFSGADLEGLSNDAGMVAVRRMRLALHGQQQPIAISADDFDQAFLAMTRSNRQFDRLDSILAESVSQFAEPVGRAFVRVTLEGGAVVEGEVLWMNSTHFKLKIADGSRLIVSKHQAAQIVPLDGTEMAPQGDFSPDQWANKQLGAG